MGQYSKKKITGTVAREMTSLQSRSQNDRTATRISPRLKKISRMTPQYTRFAGPTISMVRMKVTRKRPQRKFNLD